MLIKTTQAVSMLEKCKQTSKYGFVSGEVNKFVFDRVSCFSHINCRLACWYVCLFVCFRLYEFKDIIESEVIDIEKLRKVTFRGRWVDLCCVLEIDIIA